MVKQKSDTQKHTPKLTYTQRGKPLTEEEFDNLVREADESGYLTPEELKKNAKSFSISNKDLTIGIRSHRSNSHVHFESRL